MPATYERRKPAMTSHIFNLSITTWQQNQLYLSTIRRQVFIEEQLVPEELEWDEYDADAIHVLVTVANQPIGCARLLVHQAKIGRMAVLPKWRQQGVGSTMLQALLAEAKRLGLKRIQLSAQLHAIPFYEKAGFSAYGAVYDDAGIPHRDMQLALTG